MCVCRLKYSTTLIPRRYELLQNLISLVPVIISAGLWFNSCAWVKRYLSHSDAMKQPCELLCWLFSPVEVVLKIKYSLGQRRRLSEAGVEVGVRALSWNEADHVSLPCSNEYLIIYTRQNSSYTRD